MRADFRIIFERDPAARNWLEVLFCYPGFQALLFHRLARWLHYIDWSRNSPWSNDWQGCIY
jgi:serine O-acetyltransferase